MSAPGETFASDQVAQIIGLVAEARLCCELVAVGIDSVLARLIVPGAIAEMNALKRMAQRSAEAMDALQSVLQPTGAENPDA